MEQITITEEEQTDNGWRFFVLLGGEGSGAKYTVTLDDEYWKALTDERA